jgi:hypothetical protein
MFVRLTVLQLRRSYSLLERLTPCPLEPGEGRQEVHGWRTLAGPTSAVDLAAGA